MKMSVKLLKYMHIHPYILTLRRVSCRLLPSISSPNLVSTLLLSPVVFGMLALLFGIPPSQIYRLLGLHCLQIQSKNSPVLCCKPLSTRFHDST